MAARAYQILDVDFELESSRESFLEAFHQDYHAFAAPGAREGRRLRVRFEGGPGAFLEVDGVRQDLDDHPFPERLAALAIAQLLMDRVAAFTIIHAAVVGTPAGALAVSGPSGAGKTTLALDLLASGCAFLSDDFCPVRHGTGLVHPFPRSLWVREQPGQASSNQRRGKVLFPLDGGAFTVATRPLPLKWLVCLDLGAETAERTTGQIRLGLRGAAGGPLLDALRGLAGTEVLQAGSEWLVRYPREAGLAPRIKRILDQNRDGWWNAYALSDARPDFSKEPALVPIPPHEAAFFLLRELKHSLTGNGRTLRPGALLTHLGGLLAGVACHRLTPGPRERRLALVRGLHGPGEPA